MQINDGKYATSSSAAMSPDVFDATNEHMRHAILRSNRPRTVSASSMDSWGSPLREYAAGYAAEQHSSTPKAPPQLKQVRR